MNINNQKLDNLKQFIVSKSFNKICQTEDFSEFENFKKYFWKDNNFILKEFKNHKTIEELVYESNKIENSQTEEFLLVKDISKFLVEYFKEIKQEKDLLEISPLLELYWNKYIIYELIVFLSESLKGETKMNEIVKNYFSELLKTLKNIFYKYYNLDSFSCKKYFNKLLLKIIYLLKETEDAQDKIILYDICIKTLDSEYKFK